MLGREFGPHVIETWTREVYVSALALWFGLAFFVGNWGHVRAHLLLGFGGPNGLRALMDYKVVYL